MKKPSDASYRFLIVNKSRKTYTLSNSEYCYRISSPDGREVTEPNEKFDIYGIRAKRPKLPIGYKKQIV